MKLHPPFQISSRLMPALRIGDAWLSLNIGPRNNEGRIQYVIWIDLPNGSEHEVNDMRSGCGGGSVQDGFANLLGFLSAAAESRRYREGGHGDGENEDLFVPAVVDWATENDDEISMLRCEIEEQEGLIEP